MINGLVKFNKPTGWTSFDVVNKIRGILSSGHLEITGEKRKIKVGHSGTLDPFATGLLLVAYGACTKQVDALAKQDKTYQGVMVLGWTSTTGDIDGELSQLKNQPKPTKSDLEATTNTFIGNSQQTPPAYSAIKVDGVRAYKLARQGKQPKLEPRAIRVETFKILEHTYPKVWFECRVSSGTYIRTLVSDFAKKLDSDAYLTELNRTSIGDLSLDGSLDPTRATYKEIIDNSQSC